MGFGFLEDAFDWVKNGVSDVYNEAVKPALSPIYNKIKPVVRDVYGGLIKPGIETGGSLPLCSSDVPCPVDVPYFLFNHD